MSDIEVVEIGNLSGPPGPTGPAGPQGTPGVGVPTGGTTNQVLAKTSNTNYAVGWQSPSTGGGGPTGPAGGSLSGTYPDPALAPAAVGNLDVFTSTLKGVTPASGGGTANYLRADGTWAAPSGGGGGAPSGPAGGDLQGTYPNPTHQFNSVQNAHLVNMSATTIKGNPSATLATPQDLTGAQTTALLSTFTSTLKGLAPPSGGGTTTYLRADGTWATPAGGGGGTAATTTFTPVGTISASNVQAAIAEVSTDVATDITNHLNDVSDAHDASAISSNPVGEIIATDVQGALASLDTRIAPSNWIERLQVGADLYDDFTKGDTIASPGTAGMLGWAVPTGVATVPTYTISSAPSAIGVLALNITLNDSFSGISLVKGMFELSPAFTCEWRLTTQNLNDGSNALEAYIGLHNDVPRGVTDLATTNASTTVTSASAAFDTLIDPGKTISSPNLPAGTTIVSCPNTTTAVVSAAATATSSSQAATIIGATTGYFWKYSAASPNWRACTAYNGAITNVDTGVAVTAGQPYPRLRIVSDGGGNILYYINGTVVSGMPINTNLPSGLYRYTPAVSVRKTLGSTLRKFNLDYFALRYEKTR